MDKVRELNLSNAKLKEIQLEESIISILKHSLGGRFEIIGEYRTRLKNNSSYRVDIAILSEGIPIAFIDVTRSLEIKIQRFNNVYQEAESWFSQFVPDVRFFVVTDSSAYYVFDKWRNNGPWLLATEEFVSLLKDTLTSLGDRPRIGDIYSRLSHFSDIYGDKTIARFFRSLKDKDLVYDEDTATVSFSSQKEQQFFKVLLNVRKYDELCRYTTLEGLFLLLKKQQQNMCNPVCMNDRGEYRYADDYVFGQAPSPRESAFKEMDNCYLISLLAKGKEDDLTMWRLYGDDAKGCCLTYEVNQSLLKNSQFFLARISYGEKDGTHKELDIIKSLMQFNWNGWRFYLQTWNIWKHFFKSHHFSVEQEVRLLYYDSPTRHLDPAPDWIKNPVSQIVTKMQLFELSSFPLAPVLARIGPKCNEADLLARQFEEQAKAGKSTSQMKVTVSDITDYR